MAGHTAMAYFQWHSPLQWFGTTLGSASWLAIAGAFLTARGHPAVGAVFFTAFAVLAGGAALAWSGRARYSAARAWQAWLAAMGVLGLAATITSHRTGTYPAINLDEAGLVWLYVAVGLGVPLLVADCHWRERSNGRQGAFGAVFDVIASWF